MPHRKSAQWALDQTFPLPPRDHSQKERLPGLQVQLLIRIQLRTYKSSSQTVFQLVLSLITGFSSTVKRKSSSSESFHGQSSMMAGSANTHSSPKYTIGSA